MLFECEKQIKAKDLNLANIKKTFILQTHMFMFAILLKTWVGEKLLSPNLKFEYLAKEARNGEVVIKNIQIQNILQVYV